MMQKRRQKVMELFLDAKRTPKGCLKDVKKSRSYFGRQKVANEKGQQKVVALAFTFSTLKIMNLCYQLQNSRSISMVIDGKFFEKGFISVLEF